MATAGSLGFGSTLKLGDGASPEAFSAIAEARSIGLNAFTQEFADATSMDSVGGFRERLATLKDGGTVDVELIATAANLTSLNALAITNTLKNYQVVLPSPLSVTYTFAAYLGSWGIEVPVDDLISVTASLQISGVVTKSA